MLEGRAKVEPENGSNGGSVRLARSCGSDDDGLRFLVIMPPGRRDRGSVDPQEGSFELEVKSRSDGSGGSSPPKASESEGSLGSGGSGANPVPPWKEGARRRL